MIIDKLFAYKGNMKDEALLIFVSLQMVFVNFFLTLHHRNTIVFLKIEQL